MEVGHATQPEAPPPPDLLAAYADREMSMFGMNGTLKDLSGLCPIDLSQASLEAKNVFVVKAANEAGLEIAPEHAQEFTRILTQQNVERKFLIAPPAEKVDRPEPAAHRDLRREVSARPKTPAAAESKQHVLPARPELRQPSLAQLADQQRFAGMVALASREKTHAASLDPADVLSEPAPRPPKKPAPITQKSPVIITMPSAVETSQKREKPTIVAARAPKLHTLAASAPTNPQRSAENRAQPPRSITSESLESSTETALPPAFVVVAPELTLKSESAPPPFTDLDLPQPTYVMASNYPESFMPEQEPMYGVDEFVAQIREAAEAWLLPLGTETDLAPPAVRENITPLLHDIAAAIQEFDQHTDPLNAEFADAKAELENLCAALFDRLDIAHDVQLVAQFARMLRESSLPRRPAQDQQLRPQELASSGTHEVKFVGVPTHGQGMPDNKWQRQHLVGIFVLLAQVISSSGKSLRAMRIRLAY